MIEMPAMDPKRSEWWRRIRTGFGIPDLVSEELAWDVVVRSLGTGFGDDVVRLGRPDSNPVAQGLLVDILALYVDRQLEYTLLPDDLRALVEHENPLWWRVGMSAARLVSATQPAQNAVEAIAERVFQAVRTGVRIEESSPEAPASG